LKTPRVIIVLLRRPRRNSPNERRDDPFWEVGSFGCTGCHHRNLMNQKRCDELNGAQLAFVQGGDQGFRLVHVTPPIFTRRIGSICEAHWSPANMPLTYATAPTMIDDAGRSDIPLLPGLIRRVGRPTPIGKFASAFRSRREPLNGEIGAHVLSVYKRFRKSGEVARSYEQAMPYPPPKIERDRVSRYNVLRSLVDPLHSITSRSTRGKC
jgi:hypothetical protein